MLSWAAGSTGKAFSTSGLLVRPPKIPGPVPKCKFKREDKQGHGSVSFRIALSLEPLNSGSRKDSSNREILRMKDPGCQVLHLYYPLEPSSNLYSRCKPPCFYR